MSVSTSNKGFTRKWMLENHKSPSPFHKSKFDTVFSNQTLQKHVEDLKNSIDIELYISSRLLPEDFFINIEIFSHKHPHIPINLSRVILPRTCHNEDSNVLMIVKDLKIAGKIANTERSINHYETIFRNNGIDQKVITFMPLSQMLNGYAGYDERRKLLFMYDQFIVDKDISVKVNTFLGTTILHDGRAAFPIDFSDPLTLPDKVHKALRMVFCMYTQPTGDLASKSIIRVGRHSMANEHIVENIVDLLYQLQEIHPGGCNNVSKLAIRASSPVGSVFQIYEDKSEPVYPVLKPESNDATKTEGDGKLEMDESLLQKVYIHTSIVPSDNIIPDKEEDIFFEIRRDNHPPINIQNQISPQKPPNVTNLEQQVLKVLKQYVAKTRTNVNTSVNTVTDNRVIRRRRVTVGGNRTGRMF